MSDVRPDSMETDDLLRRARGGDAGAFDRLFAKHRRYLSRLVSLRLCPQLQARVDASDLVQEAHLEAVRRMPAYLEGQPLPFRLWLRQIACDRVSKAWRHHLGTAGRAAGREVRLPERSSLALAQQLLASGSTPSQQLDRRELIVRLRQAVAQLPDADREIILMRHFEELSNQEVGCLLGIDPATASKRHGRALLRLHKILFESGTRETRP